MKVLTIANRKGGAGKSTCAANFAVEAARAGYKTIIIDMDPQKTLETWWQKRKEEDVPLVESSTEDLENLIIKLRDKKFDLCIIDTPGDASQNARIGIQVANLVLIPSKPTAPDLSAIGRTISIVEEYKKKFIFVLTQGVVRSKATFQASSVLSSFGSVAPAVISNRLCYGTAMGLGCSAADVDKSAEEEIRVVWDFIKIKLFGSVESKKPMLVA